MTEREAIERALAKREATGDTHLAIRRTDHPHVSGDYFYVIAAKSKHAWTTGETVVAVAR